MPKRGKRKYIDKKNSITFHLVHRSQRDPLVADESAPQGVFVPAATKKSKLSEEQKEEQRKFGVYFDDDYDYLQHLRSRDETSVDWEQVEKFQIKKSDFAREAETESNVTKLQLPSSVFESEVEEQVGLLNRAAPHRGPRPELDPDVIAALDDDFDCDDPNNQLDDNFMELAMADPSDEEGNVEDDDDDYDGNSISSDGMNVSFDEDEGKDVVGSWPDWNDPFSEEETRSRFTSYSMSSSVIRRNEQLTLLDDRFEQMFAGYDDNEIGALDCDEIEGYIPPNSSLVLQCAEEFIKSQEPQKPDADPELSRLDVSDSEDEDLEKIQINQQEKWDCESILSTYSNLYNHPKLIEEPAKPQKIRVSYKNGIPLGVLDGNKLTKQALSRFNANNDIGDKDGTESIRSTLSTLSIRPKNETPEERRLRKNTVKEYRRERRIEKKANTAAFKEEKKRQEKILLNNTKNVSGIHIS